MGQSATLYRISTDTYEQLKKFESNQKFDSALAKSYATFHGSFMGLEYILAKEKDAQTIGFIREIFSPQQFISKQNFEALTPEEQFNLYERGGLIPFLNNEIVLKIDGLLNQFSDADLSSKYNAEEFNANRIYPCTWHNDNSSKWAFNERQLLEDLTRLKTIFKEAALDGDYMFVYVG